MRGVTDHEISLHSYCLLLCMSLQIQQLILGGGGWESSLMEVSVRSMDVDLWNIGLKFTEECMQKHLADGQVRCVSHFSIHPTTKRLKYAAAETCIRCFSEHLTNAVPFENEVEMKCTYLQRLMCVKIASVGVNEHSDNGVG